MGRSGIAIPIEIVRDEAAIAPQGDAPTLILHYNLNIEDARRIPRELVAAGQQGGEATGSLALSAGTSHTNIQFIAPFQTDLHSLKRPIVQAVRQSVRQLTQQIQRHTFQDIKEFVIRKPNMESNS